MRRATLNLVGAVLLLDGAALAVYYLADIVHRPRQTQMIFTVVWTFATAIVVAFLLRRVRLLRQGRGAR